MCGIAGSVRFDGGRVDPDRVLRMASALAHRGPDGEGAVFFGPGGSARSFDSRVATRRTKGLVHGVALRRTGQEYDRLRQCQFAFRAAESLVHLPRIQRDAQRPRVGVADVFGRHA